MPFSHAKFEDICRASQVALQSNHLADADRQFLGEICPMLASQGPRVRLKERDISRLEDVLAPFAQPHNSPAFRKPIAPNDPFKRYPVQINGPEIVEPVTQKRTGFLALTGLLAVAAFILIVVV